jgi:hypothetical protein
MGVERPTRVSPRQLPGHWRPSHGSRNHHVQALEATIHPFWTCTAVVTLDAPSSLARSGTTSHLSGSTSYWLHRCRPLVLWLGHNVIAEALPPPPTSAPSPMSWLQKNEIELHGMKVPLSHRRNRAKIEARCPSRQCKKPGTTTMETCSQAHSQHECTKGGTDVTSGSSHLCYYITISVTRLDLINTTTSVDVIYHLIYLKLH